MVKIQATNVVFSCVPRWGYRGVIIGWDETARAPQQWLSEMHKNNPDWKYQPNYAVLVDTRDRPAPQITYVPQVGVLELVTTPLPTAALVSGECGSDQAHKDITPFN